MTNPEFAAYVYKYLHRRLGKEGWRMVLSSPDPDIVLSIQRHLPGGWVEVSTEIATLKLWRVDMLEIDTGIDELLRKLENYAREQYAERHERKHGAP